jgi:hypothetical protein
VEDRKEQPWKSGRSDRGRREGAATEAWKDPVIQARREQHFLICEEQPRNDTEATCTLIWRQNLYAATTRLKMLMTKHICKRGLTAA